MPYADYTKEEVVRAGREIYERDLKEQLEPSQKGKFVVIDITTGDYEIADRDLTASDRLLERKPFARIYGLRVGYRTAYRMGAGRLPASSNSSR